MKEQERYVVLAILVFSAFALGWYMRGDTIYGTMYKSDVTNVGLTLPKGVLK